MMPTNSRRPVSTTHVLARDSDSSVQANSSGEYLLAAFFMYKEIWL